MSIREHTCAYVSIAHVRIRQARLTRAMLVFEDFYVEEINSSARHLFAIQHPQVLECRRKLQQ